MGGAECLEKGIPVIRADQDRILTLRGPTKKDGTSFR
jgi:hypothetical protein